MSNFYKKTNNAPLTFLFHDYETYGLSTKKTRVAQYAAIRTDANLNIIEGTEKNIFCESPLDFIPEYEACLVTGTTPHLVNLHKKDKTEIVLNEYQMFREINKDFSEPGTCSLGFNTNRFDDEITRNGFYRNLLPVYDREWKDGCTRWDIINLVREFAFFHPDKIEVPFGEDGKKMFKLDKLAPLNGFKEEGYHDALTDVRATIFMAKLVKEAAPKLWDYHIHNRIKNNVYSLMTANINKPMIMTSTYFGDENQFVEPVVLLGLDANDAKTTLVGVKLSGKESLERLLKMDAEEIAKVLYKRKDEDDYVNLPIISIKANKCPMIIPLNNIESLDISHVNKNLSEASDNLKYVLDNLETFKANVIGGTSAKPEFASAVNPEYRIYGDAFPSNIDTKSMITFHEALDKKQFDMFLNNKIFENDKYNELARLVIVRNFLDDLKQDPKYSDTVKDFAKSAAHTIYAGYNQLKYQYSDVSVVERDGYNNFDNERAVHYTFNDYKELFPKLIEEFKNDKSKMEVLRSLKDGFNEQHKEIKLLGGFNKEPESNEVVARKKPKP